MYKHMSILSEKTPPHYNYCTGIENGNPFFGHLSVVVQLNFSLAGYIEKIIDLLCTVIFSAERNEDNSKHFKFK